MTRALALALTALLMNGLGCASRAPTASLGSPAAESVVQPVVLVEQRDDAGRLTYSEVDTNADGDADIAHTHRYDAVGNLIASAVDHGADGTFDATRFAEWSASGELVEEAYDLDGDGVIDHRQRGPGDRALAYKD